jgi:hypothetical protein
MRRCSRQVRRLLAFDEIEPNLSADAWHLRATSKAILADLDVLEERVFVRTVRQQNLEKSGVADSAGKVKLCQIVERIDPVMHLVVHVEGFGLWRGNTTSPIDRYMDRIRRSTKGQL